MAHSLPTTLIGVVGLTPQVVTETLYHLAVERQQAVTDIILITTPEGQQNILGFNGLPALSDQIHALAEHYQIDPPHFDPEQSVFVGNEPIDDPKFWRTPHHSHPTLPDLLIKIFKEKSKDSDRRLHLSLAGGRKTMSALATLLFSLWARPQDELSHVLVTSEFIQWRKFFPQSPEEAEHIAVVSLPMPKLRILLDVQKLNQFSSYHKLLEYLEQEFTFDIAPPIRARVHLRHCSSEHDSGLPPPNYYTGGVRYGSQAQAFANSDLHTDLWIPRTGTFGTGNNQPDQTTPFRAVPSADF